MWLIMDLLGIVGCDPWIHCAGQWKTGAFRCACQLFYTMLEKKLLLFNRVQFISQGLLRVSILRDQDGFYFRPLPLLTFPKRNQIQLT